MVIRLTSFMLSRAIALTELEKGTDTLTHLALKSRNSSLNLTANSANLASPLYFNPEVGSRYVVCTTSRLLRTWVLNGQ